MARAFNAKVRHREFSPGAIGNPKGCSPPTDSCRPHVAGRALEVPEIVEECATPPKPTMFKEGQKKEGHHQPPRVRRSRSERQASHITQCSMQIPSRSIRVHPGLFGSIPVCSGPSRSVSGPSRFKITQCSMQIASRSIRVHPGLFGSIPVCSGPSRTKVTNDTSERVPEASYLTRDTSDLSQTPFLIGLPGPDPLTRFPEGRFGGHKRLPANLRGTFMENRDHSGPRTPRDTRETLRNPGRESLGLLRLTVFGRGRRANDPAQDKRLTETSTTMHNGAIGERGHSTPL
ncbi:hypothetical protein CRG98_028633 [Punica granatum]|uniref:Uncharacterized protein n=1 Tax=Punica granatum TaxID=22663 RepID=A0A2I0J416_PUNGR|nr:hypothetical protein CRG98_028633 [Punica granatum]